MANRLGARRLSADAAVTREEIQACALVSRDDAAAPGPRAMMGLDPRELGAWNRSAGR